MVESRGAVFVERRMPLAVITTFAAMGVSRRFGRARAENEEIGTCEPPSRVPVAVPDASG